MDGWMELESEWCLLLAAFFYATAEWGECLSVSTHRSHTGAVTVVQCPTMVIVEGTLTY